MDADSNLLVWITFDDIMNIPKIVYFSKLTQ